MAYKEIHKKKSTPYKCTDFANSTKDLDLSKRVVTGMFNSYFYIDSDMDMLLPGCASKSIQERGVNSKKGNKIKHLKDHNWSEVVARLDVIDEREVLIDGKSVNGIYHESFYPESTDSDDLLIKIQEGLYDSRSIGFRYINLELAEDGGDERSQKNFDQYLPMALNPEVGEEAGFFWVVKEIMLFEGSDVAFGANQFTPMLGLKSKEEKNLLLNQAYAKLDKIFSMFKSGKLSDDGFHQLEMEQRQIKSYISNLVNSESSVKDTILSGRNDEKDTPKSNNDALKFMSLINY